MPVAPHPSATLKNVKGLEFWEWRVPNGEREGASILKLELTGVGVLPDHACEALAGDFVPEEHYALILKEDADVYRPREADAVSMFSDEEEESEEARLIISLRKGVLSEEICAYTLERVRDAAARADNRGMAAGKIDPNNVRSPPPGATDKLVIIGNGNRAAYLREDGSVTETTFANMANSGIAGNFDADGRHPFCRQTGFTKSNPGRMLEVIPFLEACDQRFKAQAPLAWARQKKFVDDEKIHPNGWTLGDTTFTTITVNRNWRTAAHQDAGDYSGGYGNMTVLERAPGEYTGGYTGFIKFRIAADVRNGDYFCMDIHKHWHANTPLVPTKAPPAGQQWTDEDPGYERVSIVLYTREDMQHCGSQEEERAKYDKWHASFLPPKKKAALNAVNRTAANAEEEAELTRLQSLFEEESP